MTSKMLQEITSQNEDLIKVRELYKTAAPVIFNQLKAKERVFLMGTGASLQACLAALPAFLIHSGLDVQVVEARDTTKIRTIRKEDIVILISQSGNSLETRDAIDQLKKQGVEIIGITNNSDSYLWEKSDMSYPILAEDETGAATKSFSCTTYILYHIATVRNIVLFNELEKIIDDNKKTLEVMPKLAKEYAEKLTGHNVMYITGIDDAACSPVQSAIVIKEKTRIHAVGLSITEFRHGTVEVVDNGLPVVIIAIGKEAFNKAVLHKKYIQSLNGDVIIVSDDINADIVFYNSLSEEFGHINAQVFFQYFSEAVAVARGYDVDQFRYLTKTVDKY